LVQVASPREGEAQARPQAPQWAVLVLVLTHWLLHSVWPLGQRQAPSTQLWAPGQTMPQPPQWAGLLAGVTH